MKACYYTIVVTGVMLCMFSCRHSPQYRLDIQNGTGSGYYTAGTQVPITAVLPDSVRFLAWEGDVQWLPDRTEAQTTVTMPEQEVYLEAYGLKRPLVSFRYEVFPVILTHCTLSGCHLDSETHANYLNYQQVAATKSKMKNYLEIGFMPLNREITPEDRQLLLLWLAQGALNN